MDWVTLAFCSALIGLFLTWMFYPGKSQTPPGKYSLCQKKRTFNPEFFCGLLGGGGPKMHMVDYVNGSSTHAHFFFR